ncbi:hypothetical protein [Anaerolentibacter hominis]|uniref:hypothetical protein n=1 Tax=Anaerolentibacter hominis TaxID=3079009 RepID=UPI0031B865DC
MVQNGINCRESEVTFGSREGIRVNIMMIERVPEGYACRCRHCGYRFDFRDAEKLQYTYDKVSLVREVCPRCKSSDFTRVKNNWCTNPNNDKRFFH